VHLFNQLNTFSRTLQVPSVSKASTNTLARRVRSLVESIHGGSINAAATDLGMAHPTLARIVDGRVQSPRSDALEKIGKFYGVSADWLLTGEGKGPAPQTDANVLPQVELYRWYRVVDRIEPNAELKTVMYALPNAIRNAVNNTPFQVGAQTQHDLRIRASYRDAVAHELQGWSMLITTWLDGWGTETVRAYLGRDAVMKELRGGFRTPARAGEPIGGELTSSEKTAPASTRKK
jgi:transcriptional regulator with XRE-family HTH domain